MDKKRLITSIIVLVLLLGIAAYAYFSGSDINTPKLIKGVIAALVVIIGFIRVAASNKKQENELLDKNFHEYFDNAFQGKGQASTLRKLKKYTKLIMNGKSSEGAYRLRELETECKTSLDYASLYFLLGRAYDIQGNADEAISFYRNSLAHVPAQPTTWCNLGVMYADLRNYDEAVKCYMTALDYDPKYPEAHNSLCTAYYMTGEIDKCIEYAKKTLELDPRCRNAARALCFCYCYNGDQEQCDKYYKHALSLGANPKDLDMTIEAIKKEQAEKAAATAEAAE